MLRHPPPFACVAGSAPVVGELGEQTGEFGALFGGEGLERGGEHLAAFAAHAGEQAGPVVGEGDAGAARVIGVGLAAHPAAVDPLLHQTRGTRLIDADRLGEVTHAERAGCRGERLDHADDGGRAMAGTVGEEGAAPAAEGATRTRRTEAARAAIVPVRMLVAMRMLVLMLVVMRPRAAATAQTSERCRDGVGGVVGSHALTLHVT